MSIILIPAIFLSSCTRAVRPVVVEKPPIRIAFGGELDESQIEALSMTLRYMASEEFRDYKHPFPFGFDIVSSSSIEEKYSNQVAVSSGKAE